MFLMIDPTATGEKELWKEVFIQAVEDRRHPKVKESYHSGRRYVDAAQQWFESKEDGVGSFNWICFMLDLDPEKILTGINEQGFKLKNGNGNPGKLGRAIKKFREDHGISQREFSRLIEISQKTIWDIENMENRKSRYAEKIWSFLNNGGEHGPINIDYQ